MTRPAPPKGRVWLVGAGPGDPGLLTLRAREVIEQAEVIVYDRLIGPGVAEFFPEDADVVYVGKRVADHTIEQREIEEILLREAKRGKRVVRVKGGDPFLLGRGGEEAVALMNAGVEVDIVPGVTSAIAVPAYAGIPVTHRGLSGGVYVVTAHRASEGEEVLNYDLLARVDDTLVILMGAGRIEEIARGLVLAGKSPAIPAAVIQEGTTARMRRIAGELSNIAALAAEHKIDAPAVIVVGPVAEMGERLNWRMRLPLKGVRVWLTESKKIQENKAPLLARLLRDDGAEVVNAPCIATEFVPSELPIAAEFGGDAWFVFSSQTGVAGFFDLLRRERRDIRSFAGVRIAAVGPATAEALESFGLTVDYVPEVHDGQSLAQGLADFGGVAGAKIFLFRCVGEPPAWGAILERAGAKVVQVGLYQTRPTPSPVLKNVAPGDLVVLKSASAAGVFANAIAFDRSQIDAVCIGKPSAEAASQYGFRVSVAPRTDDEAIHRTILEVAGSRNS